MRFRTKKFVIITLLCLIIIALLYQRISQKRLYNSVLDTEENSLRHDFHRPRSNVIVHPPVTPLAGIDLNQNNWTLEGLRDLFFTEVVRTHVQCSSVTRVGRKGDGGWDVCMEKGYSLAPGCLAYSFGVGDIWEYDEQLASRYKCIVRVFDPTIKKPDHLHNPGPVNFYAIGIGGSKPNTLEFKTQTLLSLLKRFGEAKKVIDILKLDVEYSEWDSLLSIMNDGLLQQVKQLFLEYHTNEVLHQRSEVEHYRLYLQIMQRLERAGFRKFTASKNNYGINVIQLGVSEFEKRSGKHNSRSCCYEAYYLNMAYNTRRV